MVIHWSWFRKEVVFYERRQPTRNLGQIGGKDVIEFEESGRMRRQRFMSKNWKDSWLWKSSKKHANSIVAWKALRWKRIFLRMDQWSKTTSYCKRIWTLCTTEYFVPIVVPCMASSSSGSSVVFRTSLIQESHFSSSSWFFSFTCNEWNSDSRTGRCDQNPPSCSWLVVRSN